MINWPDTSGLIFNSPLTKKNETTVMNYYTTQSKKAKELFIV